MLKQNMSPKLYSAMATRSCWWTRSDCLFPHPPPTQEQDPPKAVLIVSYVQHLWESIYTVHPCPSGHLDLLLPHWTFRQALEHRLKEHRRALVSGGVSLSAVAQHAVDEQHDIDWVGTTVVDGHPQFHQRCTLEAWHIRSNTSTMNRDAGPLPSDNSSLNSSSPIS